MTGWWATAVHIENQVTTKRCGRLPDKGLVDTTIYAARDRIEHNITIACTRLYNARDTGRRQTGQEPSSTPARASYSLRAYTPKSAD